MSLKVKLLHPDAKAPTRGTDGAAGYDLYACEGDELYANEKRSLPIGIAVEIPQGWVGLIRDRSSFAKNDISVVGGVIDSDYRGEVVVMLRWVSREDDCIKIKAGDRIAQLVIVPCLQEPVEVVAELSETARGAGGFGSTGE